MGLDFLLNPVSTSFMYLTYFVVIRQQYQESVIKTIVIEYPGSFRSPLNNPRLYLYSLIVLVFSIKTPIDIAIRQF